MEKASGSGVKPTTPFGFGFSWADEVEREEKEEQQQLAMERQERQAKKVRPTRADPFGAARPREVVLAEKGVDWRARDRELDAAATRAPVADTAASGRARNVPAPLCARRSTPARRAPRDRGSGRTPGPRRRDADSTPQIKGAPTISASAWGGSKRKCAGEVPAQATARRVQAAGDQGRRVFGELNIGEGFGSSFRSAPKKSCNAGGSKTEESKGSEAAVSDGAGSSAMATAATATEDESAFGTKRKGRKRGRAGGSKKTKSRQPLLL